MKMIWRAAAAVALACAGNAQAAPIILKGVFDVTNTFQSSDLNFPPPQVTHVGLREYSFSGDTDTGLFTMVNGIFLGVQPCCFQLAVNGSKIALSFLGNNPPIPGFYSAGVSWTFDQDLQGDVFNVFYANMISGGVHAMATNRSGTNDLSGPAVSFSASAPGGVPEPGTWMMMIAGMATVGAALRRKTRIAFA